jgi:hypothetical protein
VQSFNPSHLAGLELWLRPDTGVLTDGASQFTQGNGEYLSIANNADVRGVATGWWQAGWWLWVSNLNDKMQFQERSGGGGSVEHTTVTAADTWYFYYIEFDGTNGSININDGTAVTGSFAGYVAETTNPFRLGSKSSSTANHHDGPMQHVCGGGGNLTAAQQTWLYNSGNGRHRGELDTGGDSISASDCKFWWPLNEVSGERRDQIGQNHLTDNATVTSAAGLVESPAVNNSPVSTWQDQSGNGNDATATGAHATKPIYKTGQINGQPAVVFDDAASQWLDLGAMTVASGDLTYIAAIEADDATAAADQYLFATQTGTVIAAHLTAASDLIQYSDGTFRGTKIAASGEQVVTFVMKAANSGEIFRDGASLESGLAFTQRAVGGNVALCSAHDGATAHFSGGVAEQALYSSGLATDPLANLHNYFARYGTI